MKESDKSEATLAVFVDFENLALGLSDKKEGYFDIKKVLERLVEKGKVVVKKAYSDWSRYGSYKQAFHTAGVEMIEIPRRGISGKNSADIRIAVDALELSYTKEHINTFVIVSGDSDFSPLAAKLKENGKHVIGLAMRDSTSELLVTNCDEFIFYDDLAKAGAKAPPIGTEVSKTKQEAFQLLLESVEALMRENKPILWSSMVKETMKRKKPSFTEGHHGYRSFSELLEDAQTQGLVVLNVEPRSGTYVVSGFGDMKKKKPVRRRSKRKAKESAAAPKTEAQGEARAPASPPEQE